MGDLYFDVRYAELYEEIEKGSCQLFEFDHPLGHVRHLFIKREIPVLLGAERYFDIVTPYGYGGPLMTGCAPEHRDELSSAFTEAFAHYCLKERVISEFIRFHPVLGNAMDFEHSYEVQYMRETVGTAIAAFDHPVEAEFSSSARKNIRKALRDGVEFRSTLGPKDLKEFQRVYVETMDRNHADPFYYFEESYFNRLLEAFGEQLLLVEALFEGQVIGMELHFVYNDVLHTHLSGTYSQFHLLSPVYVMQYATVLWAKEHGIRLIHGGGGRTNSTDDSLLRFKQQFAKHTRFAFYSGRKIWNEEIYQKLCEETNTSVTEEFFPAYRKRPAKEVSEV